jgi:predicted AAA+ superfamily ATPase
MLYPILQNLSDFDNKSHHLFDYIKHLAYLCITEISLRKSRNTKSEIKNGRNTVLISPRRMGKTGLIQNAFWQLKKAEKNVICIYIDLN